MSNPFIEFQEEVDAVNQRCEQGEITEEERNTTLRQMQMVDEQWDDVWMLGPTGQWYRKAVGSKKWMPDYPIALVDADNLPPIAEIGLPQISCAVHGCTRCQLSEGRNRAVPGEGNFNADIMLIGEGPGFHEDKQARPFVGRSGNLLEELLNNIGYKREDVFIANVVKCRPPNNRDPQPDELSACKEFLDRQIEVINPKVIVTLGRFSMNRYFPGASISRIHGQPKQIGDRLIVPMFHPAAALRNPKWRTAIADDFNRLPQLIANVEASRNQSNSEPDDPEPTTAEQLSLF